MKNPLILGIILMLALVGAAYGLSESGVWSVEDQAIVTFTVNYDDGSTKDFGVTPLRLFGLRLIDNSGKTVSSLTVKVKIKPTYVGSLSSVNYQGSNVIYKVSSNAAFIQDFETTFSGTPPSGSWTQIYSRTLNTAAIQTASKTYGSHAMYIGVQVVIKLTFSDGNSHSKDASMQGVFRYSYQSDSSFTALELVTDITPLSLTE